MACAASVFDRWATKAQEKHSNELVKANEDLPEGAPRMSGADVIRTR